MKLQPAVLLASLNQETFSRGWKKGSDYVYQHPWKTGVMVFGIGAVAAPAVVAAPVLGVAGFTANGVAAGSAAAGAHGVIGNVAANSVFAILQSAGAGGYGTAIVNGAIQAAGLAAGAGAAVCGEDKTAKRDGKDKETQDGKFSDASVVKT